MSTCQARWYRPGACGGGDGRSPTENRPRSWWLSEPPARRNTARPGRVGLDDLEAERVAVERRARLGVAHPQHGVVEALTFMRHACQRRLDVELDRDLVADEHAAGLERGVPLDAEVLAVDRAVAVKPALVLPHGSLPTPPTSRSNVTGLVTPLIGQVAVQLVVVAVGLDARRAERHRRVVLDVEEVVRAQVVVAGLVAGVDRGHLHGGVDRRLERVVGDRRCRR